MIINGMSNNFIIPVANVSRVTPVNADNTVDSSSKVSGIEECKTCKARKYQDGSNENNVSFKTPGNITPEQSFSKVSAHEGEHVKNAIAEGSKPGKKLISASVSLRTAICPECGRAYVSGGTTRTQMMSYNEKNPYEKNQKSFESEATKGGNIDLTA